MLGFEFAQSKKNYVKVYKDNIPPKAGKINQNIVLKASV